MAGEAQTMDYVRQHGYPVPAVEGVSDDGTELIMERIDGPSMVDWVSRHPWAVRRQGAILARLHHQLHAVPPPPFLPRSTAAPGDQLLHMDLHPLNVIIGPRGPVVIDWPNASTGEANVDLAVCWVLMTVGQVPGGGLQRRVLGFGRQLFVAGFLRHVDLEAVRSVLTPTVEWKVKDPHMSVSEQKAMWRLVEDNAPAA